VAYVVLPMLKGCCFVAEYTAFGNVIRYQDAVEAEYSLSANEGCMVRWQASTGLLTGLLDEVAPKRALVVGHSSWGSRLTDG